MDDELDACIRDFLGYVDFKRLRKGGRESHERLMVALRMRRLVHNVAADLRENIAAIDAGKNPQAYDVMTRRGAIADVLHLMEEHGG